VEYMAFPRAQAIAETGWTQKSLKNYDHFHKRIQAHYLLLQRMHVNYYRPSTFLTISEQPNADHTASELTLVSELFKPDIRYTTDGSSPTPTSQTYTKPIEVRGKVEIKSAIFQNGQIMGKETSYTSNHHRAIGKKVTFNNDWSTSYPAQSERTLTNGVMGSFTYQDSEQWLGYLKDLDVTLDMETVQPLSEVSIRFMQQIGPGVFLPSHVDILVSEDGVKYVNAKKINHDISEKNPELILKKFTATIDSVSARYIRIVAPNIHGGYMFIDEIMVY
jgi:hexosaminidase